MPILKPIRGIQLNKSHPLARGLRFCPQMNEAGGKFLFDFGSEKWHCDNWLGGPTWTTGPFGSAIHFTGADHCRMWPKSDYLTKLNITSAITFLAWVKLDSVDTAQDIFIRAFFNASDDQGGYTIQYSGNLTPKRFRFITRNNGASVAQYNFETTGQLVQLMAVYDGTDNILYVDGIERHRVSSVGIRGSIDPETFSISSYSNVLHGDLSRIMIWDRALSSSDAVQLCFDLACMVERGINPAMFYVPAVGISMPLLMQQMNHFNGGAVA